MAAQVAMMRQQQQLQANQKLMESLAEICFKKCAPSSGGLELERREQECVAACTDRYIEAVAVVTKSLQDRGERG